MRTYLILIILLLCIILGFHIKREISYRYILSDYQSTTYQPVDNTLWEEWYDDYTDVIAWYSDEKAKKYIEKWGDTAQFPGVKLKDITWDHY